jgi:hypothetical protein
VTNWGVHLRIFKGREETGIAEYIRANLITPRRLFSPEGFRNLVLDRYLEKYAESETPPDFNCARPFISGFMTRNRFSYRRQHFKRRPSASTEEIEAWIAWLSELLQRYDNNLIINCDETSWRLFPDNILTWWQTGEDEVSTFIQGDEKDCLTVLATISASGNKWRLFCMAKAKTARVEESQIGDVGNHWKAHSRSGWMITETFADYLRHLRVYSGTDQIIILICDLNIEIYYTVKFQ